MTKASMILLPTVRSKAHPANSKVVPTDDKQTRALSIELRITGIVKTTNIPHALGRDWERGTPLPAMVLQECSFGCSVLLLLLFFHTH